MQHANVQAEQYLLGCILMDGSLIRETELQPEHFYLSRHAEMFGIMRELDKRGQRIDFLAIGEKSQDMEYAAGLASSVPSVHVFRHYEGLVLDAWKRRRAVEVVDEFKATVDESLDTSEISRVITSLTKIDEAGREQSVPFRERVMEVTDEIQHDDGVMKGISTGFRDLDAYLHGWHNEDLIIIGARPSVGKTAIALQASLAAAKHGVAVDIFALEMADKALIRRMISTEADIDATKMRIPKKFFDKADWEKTSEATSRLMDLNISIYDKPNVSVQEVRTRVRSTRNRHPNSRHLVVIDYLQLMQTPNTRDSKAQQYGEISKSLKLIAREFKIPVIVLSQLSRDNEKRQVKRPMMSDLRESGQIEQDADVILLLHRDDYYEENSKKPDIIEVNIVKQRNGPIGRVELMYRKEKNRFVDLSRRDG